MRRSSRGRRPSNKVKTKSFTLKGGLNLVDAPMFIPEGMALAAINYELLTRNGYRRIDGYERFDGQPSPSEQSYWILNFTAGSIVEPGDGATAVGQTSGARAEVGLVVVTAGTWATNDAVGYLVLFLLSGNFTDTETISFTTAGDGFGVGFSNGFG